MMKRTKIVTPSSWLLQPNDDDTNEVRNNGSWKDGTNNSNNNTTTTTNLMFYGANPVINPKNQTDQCTRTTDNSYNNSCTSSLSRRIEWNLQHISYLFFAMIGFVILAVQLTDRTTRSTNLLQNKIATLRLPRNIRTSIHHITNNNKYTPWTTFPSGVYGRSSDEGNAKGTPLCDPKRIHLAQRTNVNYDNNDSNNTVSMTVSFSLEYEHCENVKPLVVYGIVVDDNTTNITGAVIGTNATQYNYTSTQTMKKHDIYQSDWIYHIELSKLKAGRFLHWYNIIIFEDVDNDAETRIERLLLNSIESDIDTTKFRTDYDIGDFNETIVSSSGPIAFWTPPTRDQATSIAFVGDLGQTDRSLKTASHILQSGIDISNVVIAGDMSYADSDPYRWESWFDVMEPLLRTIPLSTAAGNHEVECNTKTNDIFVHYENIFYNPNHIQDAHIEPITDDYRKTLWRGSCSCPSVFQGVYEYGNSFYSYIHGMAHIIVLNSYTSAKVGSVQYQWLVKEFETNVDRTLTPWLVVTFHSPLYTPFLGHNNEYEAVSMKGAMEPLFEKYNVNFVISGHDHAYMRTHSIVFNPSDPTTPTVDPTGIAPMYITVGAGGNREGHSKGYLHPFRQETWVAKRTIHDFGYGRFDIYNATHGLWTWVKDYDVNSFDDSTWFYNPHTIVSSSEETSSQIL